MYFLDCKSNPFKLQKIDLVGLKINKFRLCYAAKDDIKWIIETMNTECKKFSTKFSLSADNSISVRVD